jgi:hypothetical protein
VALQAPRIETTTLQNIFYFQITAGFDTAALVE